MACPLQPTEDRLVLRRVEADDRSAGGIVLPEVAKRPANRGTVLAVGPGTRLDDGSMLELPVSVGDEIFFVEHLSYELTIDGETYVMANRAGTLAVVTP